MKSFFNFFESKNFFITGFFSAFCILYNFSFSFSQGINFELVFGTYNYDDAKCIIQTLDSGYAVVGSTSGLGNGTSDIYLIKISKAGKVTWQQALGGAGIDKGNAVIQTADSGYAITGFTNNSGNGGYDAYLARTDKNGMLQWSKTYGGSDWDFGNSILQTMNGDFVICGSTYSYGKGNEDVYLLKTDSTGTLLWDSAYGGSLEDVGNSVCESTDGGYFITGVTKSFGKGNEDVYLLKSDSNGNLQWEKTYGETGEDIGSEGKFTSDGGYIVIGSTKSFDGGNRYEYWLLKTDSNGDTLWARREMKTYNMHGNSVCQTSDGGYIFGGNADVTGDDNMYLFKTDGGGWWQNYKTYGGLGIENAFSVKQTFDGGYVLVGTTDSYGAGEPNIYVLKAGSNLVSTGTILIVVGIEENVFPKNKMSLYPNPASDYIFFNSDMNSFFEIFDSMGKIISSAQIFKGNNTVDVSNFIDGIYFILIHSEKYSASEKIIVRH